MDERKPRIPKLNAEEARRRLGRQIVQIRRSMQVSASGVAGLAGISPAFERRIEQGLSVVSIQGVIKICRALGVDTGVAAEWVWLALIGAGISQEHCEYLRSLMPALAAGDCDAISGPPVNVRAGELSELAAALGGVHDKIELILRDHATNESRMLSDAEITRRNLVRLGDLIDAFPGETRDIRSHAGNGWWRELHPAERIESGNVRFVWHKTRLPSGLTALDVWRAVKAKKGARGRKSGRVDPPAWRRFLELQLEHGESSGKAYRITKFEARSNKWRFEPACSTMRHLMCEFLKDHPELKP